MKYMSDILIDNGISPLAAGYLSFLIIAISILIVCVIADLVLKRFIFNVVITKLLNRYEFKWNEILKKHKVFHYLTLMLPGIIIYFSANLFPELGDLIQRISLSYVYIILIFIINGLLESAHEYYKTFPISNIRPIKGFLQVIKIIVFIVIGIVIVATLMGKSAMLLLSGLGALAAVFSFVFKDSILGLVAGIQLTTNDMLRIGDWIEVPKYGADGDVVELSLNTVKIQNFDKTIVSVPAYALISDSFKNWRGMQDSGGRRIKRAINIDINSISFCTDEMIERFKKIEGLSEHIEQNKQGSLTNIGLFRAYVSYYLKNHPKIHRNMIQIVRQLPPTENGLPLELYVFTNDTNWIVFESIQSDIFDHLLAIVPQFDLRVFQNPAGYDVLGRKDK